ncbi:MAG: hypothetical protein ACK58L_04525 [Planctomycetota bacterium]
MPVFDWDDLPASHRLLLSVLYFVEGLGLASLIAFSPDLDWYLRVGILSAFVLPQLAVCWRSPALRAYLPGLLLAAFALCLGMVGGVVAQLVADAVGAVTAVSKGLFVVVTAAGMAGWIRLVFRSRRAAAAAGKTPPEHEAPPWGTVSDYLGWICFSNAPFRGVKRVFFHRWTLWPIGVGLAVGLPLALAGVLPGLLLAVPFLLWVALLAAVSCVLGIPRIVATGLMLVAAFFGLPGLAQRLGNWAARYQV